MTNRDKVYIVILDERNEDGAITNRNMHNCHTAIHPHNSDDSTKYYLQPVEYANQNNNKNREMDLKNPHRGNDNSKE